MRNVPDLLLADSQYFLNRLTLFLLLDSTILRNFMRWQCFHRTHYIALHFLDYAPESFLSYNQNDLFEFIYQEAVYRESVFSTFSTFFRFISAFTISLKILSDVIFSLLKEQVHFLEILFQSLRKVWYITVNIFVAGLDFCLFNMELLEKCRRNIQWVILLALLEEWKNVLKLLACLLLILKILVIDSVLLFFFILSFIVIFHHEIVKSRNQYVIKCLEHLAMGSANIWEQEQSSNLRLLTVRGTLEADFLESQLRRRALLILLH